MNTNTDETFTRTSPPLNRFTVKIGGPAPWEILSADNARTIADHVSDGDLHGIEFRAAAMLRAYADATEALTRGKDARTLSEYLDDLADGAS